jgi:hypothetical protein
VAYYISKLDPVDGSVDPIARVVKRLCDSNHTADGQVYAVFKNRRDFTEKWLYKTYESQDGKLKPVTRHDIPKQIGGLFF